jgi:hypothetical protein
MNDGKVYGKRFCGFKFTIILINYAKYLLGDI